MFTIRRAKDRGHFDHGWLNTYHTFSFSDYHDPAHMHFSDLRVINEDIVQPGEGFDTHGHRDMEIITYILSGALEHKDSMGTGSVIRASDIQYMCAGSGVTHSEFNHSKTDPVHLLQIWILPDQKNAKPHYGQQTLNPEELRDRLKLVVSDTGGLGSIRINQNAKIFASKLGDKSSLVYALEDGRRAWVQVARGKMNVSGHQLSAGDGLAVNKESELRILSETNDTEFLLFDLR